MQRFVLLILVCLLSACARQAPVQLYAGEPRPDSQVVTLSVPVELEIQSINGQPYSAANALFGASDKVLHLQPGAYRIHAFYRNGFDIDGGISHEVVRGRTAIFEIDGRAGERWALDFERPENLAEARRFRDRFPAWASNLSTGERFPAGEGGRNVSMLSLTGSVERPTEATSVQPLGSQPQDSGTARPDPAPMVTLPHSDATLETLKQLWNLLGPQSREAFLEWTAQ